MQIREYGAWEHVSEDMGRSSPERDTTIPHPRVRARSTHPLHSAVQGVPSSVTQGGPPIRRPTTKHFTVVR